jgi:hypothetical protein
MAVLRFDVLRFAVFVTRPAEPGDASSDEWLCSVSPRFGTSVYLHPMLLSTRTDISPEPSDTKLDFLSSTAAIGAIIAPKWRKFRIPLVTFRYRRGYDVVELW